MERPAHGYPCWVRGAVDRETTPTAFGMKRGLPALAARWFSQSLSALWVLRSISERVSLIYRNDDGVNAGTESTVFHVDGAESIVGWPDRLAKSGASSLPPFSGNEIYESALSRPSPQCAINSGPKRCVNTSPALTTASSAPCKGTVLQ